MFEYDAEIALCSKPPRDVLQISNLRVTFNASKPVGQRVVSLETGGRHCESGHTQQFEPVNRTQVYRVVGNSFLMNGGDGFNVIKKNKQNHVYVPICSALIQCNHNEVDSVSIFLFAAKDHSIWI